MLGCEPIGTPIEQNHGLEEYPDQVPTNKGRYQRLVGRLIYLSHTRPNICICSGNLVTWKSKKLKVVYLLSPDIEYRAMVKGVCEVLWLKRLMGELGFPTEDTMKLYCDNQSAIKIAENPVQHDRMKHAVSNQAFTDSLAKLGICDIYAPS
ncbi:hypothetical protein L3X38_007392 [Prunus dulcis]|uniref:Uncharacterized protein n=1 Tax=Prunus dulcis TaxID=3755 RepID=A0AAD5F5Y3_PRUDU|nr:hypothetical protein L3X38_007392 [Prunus dulcis]